MGGICDEQRCGQAQRGSARQACPDGSLAVQRCEGAAEFAVGGTMASPLTSPGDRRQWRGGSSVVDRDVGGVARIPWQNVEPSIDVEATCSVAHHHSSGTAALPQGPQGPSLRSGYAVPVHHRLTGPIRPAHRHAAISRQSYARNSTRHPCITIAAMISSLSRVSGKCGTITLRVMIERQEQRTICTRGR